MDSEELISFLQKNPGTKVLLASDPEGNSYSSVDEACRAYVFTDYVQGETEEVFDAEDIVDESDPDEAVLANFKPVVVIYPA
jgi:hypothetical protein